MRSKNTQSHCTGDNDPRPNNVRAVYANGRLIIYGSGRAWKITPWRTAIRLAAASWLLGAAFGAGVLTIAIGF